MDITVKNNESILGKLNFDLLSNNIKNYNEVNIYNNSIYIPNFKMNLFWEIARYKCPIILFLDEDIVKNNLSLRLESQSNIFIFPQTEKIYLNNFKKIKFDDNLIYKNFMEYLKISERKFNQVIFYNIKKPNNIFNKFKIPTFGYFKNNDLCVIPKIISVNNFISFMVKNHKKVYYVGNSIEHKDIDKIDYCFINKKKCSQYFLDINGNDMKKLFSQNRKTFMDVLRRPKHRKINLPKTDTNINLNKIITVNNIVNVLENPEKNKKILTKDYKKYLEKLGTIEYPDLTNISKINFIIKDNPILDLSSGSQIELLEYQLMYNLTNKFMVYYNSVLLNDKIDKNNFIDMVKFMKEYNDLKKNNYLYKNTIVKCPKNKFSLIFYVGDTKEDLEIYNNLPFPKILTSNIVRDIWDDDRHIISFPSLSYKNVISSGLLKDELNNEITLPKRYFLKENFIGPRLNVRSSLKLKYYADYIILLETNNKEAIEISLMESLLEKFRLKYNKNIILVLSVENYKTEHKWIKHIKFSNYFKYIFEFDLVIVLDDIWKNNYSLTYTILECINREIPLLLSRSPIILDKFSKYPGLFDGLNNNIIGINNLKVFFENKMKELLSDELEETEYLKIKKNLWNRTIMKNYESYFVEIINFLKMKNYKRDTINLLENSNSGYNFYYHENITSMNLLNIYSNIDNFFDLIKDYKNILLISSDYPGYGGAASLNNEIAKVLRLKGHNCKELYYLFNGVKNADKIIKEYSCPNDYFNFDDMLDDNDKFFYNDIRVCKINNMLGDLEKMEFKPDLIILKNHLNGMILPKRFNKIFFLVAGIYKNSLNKYYFNLSVSESEKLINENVLNLLNDERVTGISNSSHTQTILDKHFSIKTELYYVNFIPYYPNKIPVRNNKEFNKRVYDYGIICSDFTRNIKNLKYICNELADNVNNNDKIIFIGKNSSKYSKLFKSSNVTCVNLVPNYLVCDYLKKIKNVIINSYYESNSNLAIQAKFNGCNVIRRIKSRNIEKLSILITSTQKPGYGGSATNAYKLTKILRSRGYNVAVVFFNKEKAETINKENIEGFFTIRDNIKTYEFYYDNDKIKVRNDIISYLGNYPKLIFAFNYYTPIMSKKLFPCSYLYYFVVGNPVLSIGKDSMINSNTSIQKFLKKDYKLESYDMDTYNHELLSIKVSDEVVIDQGELTIETISKVHPNFKYLFNNYYNYGIDILNNDSAGYTNRKEFELIAVSSNWQRVVKNPRLVYLIFKKFPEYRKIVIGKNSDMFDKLPNTTCLNLLSYDETQQYLSKSKVLLITSYSETGPNTLIESFNQKCQVLSSKNIGYKRYLSNHQLCEDIYDIGEWCSKAKYLIDNFSYLPIPHIDIQEDKVKFQTLINHKNINRKVNVLVVCGDKPYYGGAATNSYNIIKTVLERGYNVSGLFISYQKTGLDDPDEVGCVEHIFLDDKIKESLLDWKSRNTINFDIIFCKNYKVFTLIKHLFPSKTIIYSPSGLRQLTAIISKRKNYYSKMDDIVLEDSKHELIKDDNWYNFIMKNDKYLENYAFENADYLLPNSKLTHDIIKSYCNENIKSKLLEPIYLSNIQFIDQKNFNFRKRDFDFAFIATNWKRATKNIWLVKSLIKKLQGTSYKILVVGNNHTINEKTFPKENYPNLVVKDHILRSDMVNLYSNIKTLVVTSFYESNPNVMIEAIYNGCNVITSVNTGNHENLRRELLVKDPSKISNWLSCMDISSKKLFPYLGPSLTCVKEQLMSVLDNFGNKQEAIGIYKVNAKWDLSETIERVDKPEYEWIESERLENFEEHKGRMTDIYSNIYLHMFKGLCERLKFKNSHYIFIDESLKQSIRTKWNNINIWILKTQEEVMYFNQGKFYFVRGNYPNFYEKLIPINAYSIYYPATSFKYNYNIKSKERIIKRDLINYFTKRSHPQYKKFDMVLHHEDENYFKQFTENKMVYFKKFSIGDRFNFQESDRDYDIIYVGQAKQKSKNHQLFFDFLRYCGENRIKIKVAYVSDKDYLKENYKNYYESENEDLIIDFYNNISPDKLCELYNRSKINLMLSNRDCVPRVIVESLMCGCYNVGTDLLSDGKYYYDGVCGELLGFNYGEVELLSAGMVTYVSNDMIFKKLLKLVKEKYDHKKISLESQKLYSLENTLDDMTKYLI